MASLQQIKSHRKVFKDYAFIDAQNLYLGIKELGWKLNFKRFRVYLKEKYGVEKAYLDLKDKLRIVLAPSPKNCSSLLRRIAGKKIAFVSDLRHKLEYIKKEPHADRTA